MIKNVSKNTQPVFLRHDFQKLHTRDAVAFFIKRRAEYTDSEVVRRNAHDSSRNAAFSYYMKQYDIFKGDVEEVMDLYTKQCAIKMSSLDLAKIGCVFALDGKHPETGEQVIKKDVARICKTFMVTCGMYNASS